MDRLQKTALAYQQMLQIQYYFEISKKQNIHKFILSFDKSDFYHLAGLHKLADITQLQSEKNKSILFKQIINSQISLEQIKNSNFYHSIEKRILYLERFPEILDQNQSIFRYLDKNNNVSLIKADYLLENVLAPDILFVFLSERKKSTMQNIPNMCCRSFFPMNKLDYSINQPAYTLLKKIKIDIAAGNKTILYDRSKIIEESKRAASEQERRSILQQLNEKKAQQTVSDVLSEKRRRQQDHTRF